MKNTFANPIAIVMMALSWLSPSLSLGAEATGPSQIATNQDRYGEYLVDSKGFALYIFETDTQNSGTSNCYGECAKVWPPLLIQQGVTVVATGNVKSSMIGTLHRTDGTTQVTYNGWPLYYMEGEMPRAPMCHGIDMNGGNWWLIKPDGSRIS